MLKRIAVAGALTAAALLVSPVGAAHAEECKFSLPAFPDECVSQELYTYVTSLQVDDQESRVRASRAEADAYQLRAQLWQSALDVQAARQATSFALSERDEALDQIARLDHRVILQRATIKRLRDRLHAVV